MVSIETGRIFRILLACVALGMVSGCATSFIYERADHLTDRWLNGYLELDPLQQEMLANGLDELHQWHRSEQLPHYAEWLRRVGMRLDEADAFTGEELQTYGEELGEFWRELAVQALPLLTEIGSGLEDEQVSTLISALREEQVAQFEAESERPGDWHQQRRARSMSRFLRRWTGSLSNEQRDAIRDWSQTLEPSRAAYHQNRLGWIDELESALARRGDLSLLAESAETLIISPTSRWNPEYEALVRRNTASTTLFMVEFIGRLEPRQRQRAHDRLQRLADEFEQLSLTGS